MKNATFLALLLFPRLLAAQDSAALRQLEISMRQAITSGKVPSVCIAVARDGKIVYEQAFGWADIKGRQKATIHTAYQLASVSKPMTATGVMKLYDDQRLHLDSPALLYMKPLRFKGGSENGRKVTIRHLLNHSSGLGTYFDIGYTDENRPLPSFAAGFAQYGHLFHPPGLISEYSNLGYGLLDYLISRQSKLSFGQYMEREIFTPLGMRNSFVQGHPHRSMPVARKYDAELKQLPEVVNSTAGAGNIYASVHDLLLFGLFHLNSPYPGQKPILPADKITQMHYWNNEGTLYPFYDSAVYSLGWYYKKSKNGYSAVWHEGGMMGASSILRLVPEKGVAVAIVMNVFDRAFCTKLADQFTRLWVPGYPAQALDEEGEISRFRHYTADTGFRGNWKGHIVSGKNKVPCSIEFGEDGKILFTYLDDSYRSWFTADHPLPHQVKVLGGIVNEGYFIGLVPGQFAAPGIRPEFSQLLSLKLYRSGRRLEGSLVAMAAAPREYYAYPFMLSLEKE